MTDSSSVSGLDSLLGSYEKQLQASQTRVVNKELGKNEFLQLLAAQMQNQNPLEPTSDTDFIAQMAQFSALEQMQNVASGIQQLQGYSMIGKLVYTEGTDAFGEAVPMYGIIDVVYQKDGENWVAFYDMAAADYGSEEQQLTNIAASKIMQIQDATPYHMEQLAQNIADRLAEVLGGLDLASNAAIAKLLVGEEEKKTEEDEGDKTPPIDNPPPLGDNDDDDKDDDNSDDTVGV